MPSAAMEPDAWPPPPPLPDHLELAAAARKSLRLASVFFSFCAALFLGGLKAFVIGPTAGAIVIVGNIGVILMLFPFHVSWTAYTIHKTYFINSAIKLAFFIVLPVLIGLYLGLSIFGSILLGLGYGVFTPWIATFEAFREESKSKMLLHIVVDGTWSTIKGSCTVVRDFADICFHSYPLYLKEMRESPQNLPPHSISMMYVPLCIIIILLGLLVDVPFYTIIAVVKSPYMLFKGWQRLLQDLISREGPFLETVCVPIAGLAILFWPLIVVVSVVFAIVSSIFVGLYAAVIVYQEKSFQKGVAYVIAMVAEFDEYTNDTLHLPEGSFLPKPSYRRTKPSYSTEFPMDPPGTTRVFEYGSASSDPPDMLVPNLVPERPIRDTIQEVKMVQIWESIMKSCEIHGRELLDHNIITTSDISGWLQAKEGGDEMIGLGLPSYAFLHTILISIKTGSGGLLLYNGIEVNQLNCPQDRLLDWIFKPVLVLKQQIQVLKMRDEELKFLEKLVLFVGDSVSANRWDNGSGVPQNALRTAQIQAISRRMVGIWRSVTKFPTYRRRYRKVLKSLIYYNERGESCGRSPMSNQSPMAIRSPSSVQLVSVEL